MQKYIYQRNLARYTAGKKKSSQRDIGVREERAASLDRHEDHSSLAAGMDIESLIRMSPAL